MALTPISNGDSGLDSRNKINTAFTQVDANETAIALRLTIADAATTYEPKASQSEIAASAIDWNFTHLYKTLSANTTFTFSNAANAKTIIIAITNTGANYTVTWPAGVLWVGGVEPVQTVGAKTDVYTLIQINGAIYGSYIQDLS